MDKKFKDMLLLIVKLFWRLGVELEQFCDGLNTTLRIKIFIR